MNNRQANPSIKCTVQQCVHHCQGQDYCSLDCITVGTHELNPHHGPVHRLQELRVQVTVLPPSVLIAATHGERRTCGFSRTRGSVFL